MELNIQNSDQFQSKKHRNRRLKPGEKPAKQTAQSSVSLLHSEFASSFTNSSTSEATHAQTERKQAPRPQAKRSGSDAAPREKKPQERKPGARPRPPQRPTPKAAATEAAPSVDDRKSRQEKLQEKKAKFGKVRQQTELPNVTKPAVQRLSGDADEAAVEDPEQVFGDGDGTFASLKLSPRLVRLLESSMQMTRPTRIQSLAIPQLLTCRDVMVKSETGTGKTLAYLLPIVERLQSQQPRLQRADGTKAIVLAPTRELCLQIFTVLSQLLRGFHWIVAGTVMGGEKKKSEKARIRKGLTVLLATPGRLLDHLQNTSALNVSGLSFLVLDEADRLLDLGFERDIKAIFALLDQRSSATTTPKRQSVLVSATLEERVQGLVSLALHRPLSVGFEGPEPAREQSQSGDGDDADSSKHKLPTSLSHYYLHVESSYRLAALASFLRWKVSEAAARGALAKVVVFASTCAGVDFLHTALSHAFWPDNSPRSRQRAASGERKEAMDEDDDGGEEGAAEKPALLAIPSWRLHGNRPQQERTNTYLTFCSAAGGVLFCTDVAARGLDLAAVDWIVQYDPPELLADYIHRAGRTGRLGRKGSVVTFLLESELGYLDVLRGQGIECEAIALPKVFSALNDSGLQRRPGDPLPGAVLHRQLENMVADNAELHELAANAFHAWVRAYASYPHALKAVFHPRKLHIGHVANSFALKEPPSKLLASAAAKSKRSDREEDDERPGQGKKKRQREGEFDEARPKQKKTKSAGPGVHRKVRAAIVSEFAS